MLSGITMASNHLLREWFPSCRAGSGYFIVANQVIDENTPHRSAPSVMGRGWNALITPYYVAAPASGGGKLPRLQQIGTPTSRRLTSRQPAVLNVQGRDEIWPRIRQDFTAKNLSARDSDAVTTRASDGT